MLKDPIYNPSFDPEGEEEKENKELFRKICENFLSKPFTIREARDAINTYSSNKDDDEYIKRGGEMAVEISEEGLDRLVQQGVLMKDGDRYEVDHNSKFVAEWEMSS